MNTIEYIKSSIENYNSLIIKFESLSKIMNERLNKIENGVDKDTEKLSKEFGEEISMPVKKTVPKKTAPKKTKAADPPPVKIDVIPLKPLLTENEKEKEPVTKKKFETPKDYFIFDFPLNKQLYREFIPSKVSLNLPPEEVIKKTAVKSNPKLEEFKVFLKNRKDEYNSLIL